VANSPGKTPTRDQK